MKKSRPPSGAQEEKPPWDDDPFDAPLLCAEDIDALAFSEMGPVISVPDPFEPGIKKRFPNPYFNGIEVLGSFKEYLMGHFSVDYQEHLHEILASGRLNIGKDGYLIAKPDWFSIDSIRINRIDLYRKSATEVYADIIMEAHFTFHAKLKTKNLQESVSQWYRVRTYSDLSPDRLSFNNLVFAAVYDYREPRPGKGLVTTARWNAKYCSEECGNKAQIKRQGEKKAAERKQKALQLNEGVVTDYVG